MWITTYLVGNKKALHGTFCVDDLWASVSWIIIAVRQSTEYYRPTVYNGLYVSSGLKWQISEDERGVQISWCLRFQKDEQYSVNSHVRLGITQQTCVYWTKGKWTNEWSKRPNFMVLRLQSDNCAFTRTCLGLYHIEDFVRKRTVKFMNNLVTNQFPNDVVQIGLCELFDFNYFND